MASRFIKNNIKKLIHYAFSPFWMLFVFHLGLVGCKKNQKLSLFKVPLSQEIRIGEVGSMTGSQAIFGLSTHQGIALGIHEINEAGGLFEKELKLISYDDLGQASEALTAVTKLIHQDGVLAILGEAASTLSIAMGTLAQRLKIPLISPSAINSKVTEQGDFVFRVCYNDIFQAKIMAEFAFDHLKVRRVAIFQDMKTDYSRDLSTYFTKFFREKGGEILLVQSYSTGDINFKSQLINIRTLAPQWIIVPGYYTEVALIARQKKELGINIPMLGGDAWESSRLLEIAENSLDGSYYISPFNKDSPDPKVKNFVENYKKMYQSSPDSYAALGYDAFHFLVDALSRTPSLSPQEIRNTLAAPHDFKGVTGKISLDIHRNTEKTATFFKIQKGAVIVEPFTAASPPQ